MLIGYNSNEGLIILSDIVKNKRLKQFDDDFVRLIPSSLNVESNDPQRFQLIDEVRDFYLAGHALCEENLPQLEELLSDNHFGNGMHLTAQLYAKYQSSTPVYFYRFAVSKELNVFKRLVVSNKIDLTRYRGACHGDDLYYLFRYSGWIGTRTVCH